jgi:hypothetical protein
MAQWRERVRDLLYEGESVREAVALDSARVVVTSHRVLAFTPDADGANFHQVDRPNVEGVEAGARAEAGLLERTVKVGVVGVVLLGAGVYLDFESLLGDVNLAGGDAAGRIGIGSVLGPLQGLLDLLRNLDQYLLLSGALALVLAAVLGGAYWYLRDRTLVVEVAGGEDIHVPRPDGDADAADRLERAIAPDASAGPRPADRTDASRSETARDPLGES